MLNIENVYVIHYTKLIERKNKIIEQFKNISNNLIFINDYDKDVLDNKILSEFYYPNKIEWDNKISNLWDIRRHSFRYLNNAEISCTIKHIKAIEYVALNGDSLIIEDDLIINSDFEIVFNNMINQIPNDCDAVIIGSGCNMHIIGDGLIKSKHPATRCLDSYYLKQKSAIDIIKTIKPFQLVSDWEMAYQFYLHNMNVYWLEPSPCFQGSEKGIYKSTLR